MERTNSFLKTRVIALTALVTAVFVALTMTCGVSSAQAETYTLDPDNEYAVGLDNSLTIPAHT